MLELLMKKMSSFRPHQGIIEFNLTAYTIMNIQSMISFRPHQGIIEFNLTQKELALKVGVAPSFRPHQGIIEFNGTSSPTVHVLKKIEFPSPSGDY